MRENLTSSKHHQAFSTSYVFFFCDLSAARGLFFKEWLTYAVFRGLMICEKERKSQYLCGLFCFFDAPPSTPFSPSKVPSQYDGQGWIRTNDYVNRFSFLSILRDATVISCSLTTHRKHDKCISRNRHH